MNIESAKQILLQLFKQGVKTLCLCPGARNAPFIALLEKNKNFEVLSFFDERSAGFFALGRSRRDGQPVAVLTTSGTAVSELLSPVIEAHYTHTPLVVLSSDRPKRLRGTGAPQAIEQAQIFSGFVEKSFDFESQEPKEITLSLKGPSHINICFDEPLIDQPVMPWAADARESAVTHKALSLQAQKQNFEQALIVVGSLNSQERSIALNWLPSTGAPVFAEASSGLRSSEFYQKQGLWGGEKIVSKLLTSGEVKNVIRLGDVPLGRYWRDLDQRGIPVFSYSTKKWSGLSVGSIESGQWDQNSFSQIQVKHWAWQHWLELGLQKRHSLHQLIDRYPESEIAFFRDLAQSLSFDDSLYLGNSLPVRLWDLVCESGHTIRSNRGANGIDGQLSTALGWSEPNRNHWVVLGDLTSLYDMNAPWVTSYLFEKNIKVNWVVSNNGGGQIFSRIFESSLFRNTHQIQFQPLAAMWGWSYQRQPRFEKPIENQPLNLIEWSPKAQQSHDFWKEYDHLWQD